MEGTWHDLLREENVNDHSDGGSCTGMAWLPGAPPTLRVKRLHQEAKLPTYATDGSACMDLYACITSGGLHFVPATGSLRLSTGVSVEVPPGWALMIYSRSGDGFNRHLRLSNCVGVIDSDYRGPLMVKLHNDGYYGQRDQDVCHGDRIAQAMLVRAPRCAIVEVEELTPTARGDGGFGSTGR